MEAHKEQLQLVLERLRKNQLRAKKSKCEFAQRRIEYLGHVITEREVATDSNKIQCMLDWPTPKTVKGLRGFLGLTGYYRKFVSHYGILAKPLTQLLKKGQFIWGEEAEEAFNKLKAAMASTPVLALPDYRQTFVVETDACYGGVGAVLMQEGHPLAYLSKALGPRSMGLSIYEKEFLATILAVSKWRYYLVGGEFIIRTDQ